MIEQAPPAPTCTLSDASRRLWDAIVIGSGPSGAVVAFQLARQGASVLLVDKAAFPRRKVCGCYLSGSGLATLNALGLSGTVNRWHAPQVTKVRIGTRGRTAELSLPAGTAISRETLDTSLVREAICAGANFLPRTSARVRDLHHDHRVAELKIDAETVEARAKTLIVADGVGGQSLQYCSDIAFKLAPRSLVGASAMTVDLPTGYVAGTIHMAIGREGYVGALQLENGQLDIAAALDPLHLRQTGPGELAQRISDQSGLPSLPCLTALRWQGTPPLSRTPTTPAADRLFLVGDAAGYVEPFTGEGMSWALASGRAVLPFVLATIDHDRPHIAPSWAREHRRLLKSRQRLCRLVTRGLRQPWLAGLSVSALGRMPVLATPVVRWLNRSPGLETA